mgnify:CR=1 FL=1
MLAVSYEQAPTTHPAISEQMAQQLHEFQQQMQGPIHIDTVVGNVNIVGPERRKRASVNV